MWALSGYFGLLLAAFGAATLLPMQSEAVLVAHSRSGALYSDANARYLGWMAALAVISELPYRLLSSDSSTAQRNVFAAAGAEWELQPYTLLIVLTAFAALLIGLWLLRRASHFRIWPVTRWGYWFYPGHLAALHLIRSFGYPPSM